MSEISILKQTNEQLIFFIDELIELLPQQSGNLLLFRFFLNDKIPMTEIMEYMMQKLLPLKQHVVDKNDKFFLENNILFEKLNNSKHAEEKINGFKEIWVSGYLDAENKETIWKWFKTFIFLTEKYKMLINIK